MYASHRATQLLIWILFIVTWPMCLPAWLLSVTVCGGFRSRVLFFPEAHLVNALMVHAPVYPVDTHVSKEQKSSDAPQHSSPA